MYERIQSAYGHVTCSTLVDPASERMLERAFVKVNKGRVVRTGAIGTV